MTYFPYFRGKQFELLALKEYANELAQSGEVRPLIEPVKDPARSGGLTRCLRELIDAGVSPIVVINPSVGDLATFPPTYLSQFLDSIDPANSLAGGILIDDDTTPAEVGSAVGSVRNERQLVLCHVGKNAELARIAEALGGRPATHIVTSEARIRHYKSAFPGADMAVLTDGFKPQVRNSDFLAVTAYTFSDDHLFYEEEGLVGFGDYLTIGKGFSEGGFTPRAVAIHWTYLERPDGPIMIRHFVSENNGDTSNVGGKYLEAVSKLVAFIDQQQETTRAGNVFRQHLLTSTYPGLGIVKKLSMQNHLEVVMKAIAPR